MRCTDGGTYMCIHIDTSNQTVPQSRFGDSLQTCSSVAQISFVDLGDGHRGRMKEKAESLRQECALDYVWAASRKMPRGGKRIRQRRGQLHTTTIQSILRHHSLVHIHWTEQPGRYRVCRIDSGAVPGECSSRSELLCCTVITLASRHKLLALPKYSAPVMH